QVALWDVSLVASRLLAYELIQCKVSVLSREGEQVHLRYSGAPSRTRTQRASDRTARLDLLAWGALVRSSPRLPTREVSVAFRPKLAVPTCNARKETQHDEP